MGLKLHDFVSSVAARFPAARFFLNFFAARGIVSACAFASQMVVAMRLGPKDYLAYLAAYAVILLTAEAQCLAGNLEVLAKGHPGIGLGSVLTNRLYFNVLITAPALWALSSFWGSQIGPIGIAGGIAAVVSSAFFPGSYGSAGALGIGLRCEAGVGAALLLGRAILPASLALFWILLCVEIVGRAAVGLILAAVGRHLQVRPQMECGRQAIPYGVVSLFQVAFQRLEIAILPAIAISKVTAMAWGVGSNILFALNAVLYQALIGYRVVETRSSIVVRRRELWALASGGLAISVLLLSRYLSHRRTATAVENVSTLVLLGAYFFAISFENFTYMDFFFSMGRKRILGLSVGRLAFVLIFAGMAAMGVNGIVCLAWILIAKLSAAIVEMLLVAKCFSPRTARSGLRPCLKFTLEQDPLEHVDTARTT